MDVYRFPSPAKIQALRPGFRTLAQATWTFTLSQAPPSLESYVYKSFDEIAVETKKRKKREADEQRRADEFEAMILFRVGHP